MLAVDEDLACLLARTALAAPGENEKPLRRHSTCLGTRARERLPVAVCAILQSKRVVFAGTAEEKQPASMDEKSSPEGGNRKVGQRLPLAEGEVVHLALPLVAAVLHSTAGEEDKVLVVANSRQAAGFRRRCHWHPNCPHSVDVCAPDVHTVVSSSPNHVELAVVLEDCQA